MGHSSEPINHSLVHQTLPVMSQPLSALINTTTNPTHPTNTPQTGERGSLSPSARLPFQHHDLADPHNERDCTQSPPPTLRTFSTSPSYEAFSAGYLKQDHPLLVPSRGSQWPIPDAVGFPSLPSGAFLLPLPPSWTRGGQRPINNRRGTVETTVSISWLSAGGHHCGFDP